MYTEPLGLTDRPFAAVPRVDHYFPASLYEQSRQSLIRTIDRGEGPAMLIGGPGTGKTLMCRLLAEHFRKDFLVVMLANSRLCTRRALLQSILFELEMPFRDLSEGELRLSLVDRLESRATETRGLLLLVDEAHTLSLRLLEELRQMTNLVRHGEPRVRLVLAGDARLDERFTSPRLESFQQRIANRCFLQPLTQTETVEFVSRQVAVAGGEVSALFDEGALRAVFFATGGIPRLVNQVCDHSLVLAVSRGQRHVDAALVEEAWADLQQLPMPVSSPPPAAAESSILEFGSLEANDPPPASAAASDPAPPVLAESPAGDSADAEESEPAEIDSDTLAWPSSPADEGTPDGEADPFFGGVFAEEETVYQAGSELPGPCAADASQHRAASPAAEAAEQVEEASILPVDASAIVTWSIDRYAAEASAASDDTPRPITLDLENDDRDILVIHGAAGDDERARPHRSYGRLFQQLRRGHFDG